jgi:hypothetical protein
MSVVHYHFTVTVLLSLCTALFFHHFSFLLKLKMADSQTALPAWAAFGSLWNNMRGSPGVLIEQEACIGQTLRVPSHAWLPWQHVCVAVKTWILLPTCSCSKQKMNQGTHNYACDCHCLWWDQVIAVYVIQTPFTVCWMEKQCDWCTTTTIGLRYMVAVMCVVEKYYLPECNTSSKSSPIV